MKITLEEQGLRDGIQNLSVLLPTEKKLEYIDRLVAAGIQRIQVGSFVHPRLVPQMADVEEVCKRMNRVEGVVYDGLVLNGKGVERGIDAGLEHLSMSFSASDTHSQKNVRMTQEEAKAAFAEMVKLSKKNNIVVRGGVQCAFGCRYEGMVEPKEVLDLVKFILDNDVEEIALADSTGMANPKALGELVAQVVELANGKPVALHLHNTESKGLANLYAAIQAGAYRFDTAFGGLGGCPFIKSATGNIATEDTAHMLHQMGYETGIDIGAIAKMSLEMQTLLGHPLQGKMHQLWEEDVKIV